jgi:hypothetical protein
MDRTYGDARYKSSFVEDRQQGFAGCELLSIRNGEENRIATVLFWDAAGQFFVETFGDLPLEVLELLIEETKSSVVVR